jgi:hypothetical protein
MDAYRKAGRGGAGNFWSKKDVEEVIKRDDGVSSTYTNNRAFAMIASMTPNLLSRILSHKAKT